MKNRILHTLLFLSLFSSSLLANDYINNDDVSLDEVTETANHPELTDDIEESNIRFISSTDTSTVGETIEYSDEDDTEELSASTDDSY